MWIFKGSTLLPSQPSRGATTWENQLKKEVSSSLVIVSCLEAAGLIFLSEPRVLGQRTRRKGSFSKMWASCHILGGTYEWLWENKRDVTVVVRSTCQWRRHKSPEFNPWVRKIPQRRAWQPTPVFLPGESHGQRSLVGDSPWGYKELDTAEAT